MKKDTRFSVLSNIPQEALTGMHRDTKRIIEQLRQTKGKVLSWKGKNAHDAKIRMDAMRRARKRGHVNYKEAHRKAGMLYFRVR